MDVYFMQAMFYFCLLQLKVFNLCSIYAPILLVIYLFSSTVANRTV